MARVQQTTILKALKTIGNLKSSPAFPSREQLLESNRTLHNVVTSVRVECSNIPVKTICGLLVDALNLENDVTGEALWKRYRRVTANRDGSGVNRDAPKQLFIPPGISQPDLTSGIAKYFRAMGYNSTSLLKTCLKAMDEMPLKMEASEIKRVIDAQYPSQDKCDTGGTESDNTLVACVASPQAQH